MPLYSPIFRISEIYDKYGNIAYLDNGDPTPEGVKGVAIKIVCNNVWEMSEGFKIGDITEIIGDVKCPRDMSSVFYMSKFTGDISRWDTMRIIDI